MDATQVFDDNPVADLIMEDTAGSGISGEERTIGGVYPGDSVTRAMGHALSTAERIESYGHSVEREYVECLHEADHTTLHFIKIHINGSDGPEHIDSMVEYWREQ